MTAHSDRTATDQGPIAVLVGAPGSGKTTVGRLLAQQLGVSFRDTDAEIEASQGKSVAQLFVDDGEPEFRRLERAAVAAALHDHDGVVSLGGGAILDDSTRSLLANRATIWLRVGPETASARVGMSVARPLLLGNVRRQLVELLRERSALYAQVADLTIDTDGREPVAIAAEIAQWVQARMSGGSSAGGQTPVRIPVTGGGVYEVVVGVGLQAEVVAAIPAGAARVAVIHPPALAAAAADLGRLIAAAGIVAVDIAVPAGEAAKTAAVAQRCWSMLGEAEFTRSDAVIGFGGGSTTDVAGFVAATWLRGVALIQVPTTLLAMVDAAVGGKTGINTAAGKNLVGSFYAPRAVIADTTLLAGVPHEDQLSGLAEVIKAGFIHDPQILDLIASDPVAAADPTSELTTELIVRAIRVKASVVSQDFRETGGAGSVIGREALNYGHTLGHAIERVESYRWRHGDAVAIGMIFAAELAHSTGHLGSEAVQRHREIIGAVGLPITYRRGVWPQLLDAMAVDKKTRGHVLRFVILDGIGKPTILPDPDQGQLAAAYDKITES